MTTFPCYTPPPGAVDIPACANWLYDKNTVIVHPVNPIGQDDLGGQTESYGATYELACNVQVSSPEPTDFIAGPRQGKLYTRNLTGVKPRDVFIYEGVRWRVKGIDVLTSHIERKEHHLEADVEVIETSVT